MALEPSEWPSVPPNQRPLSLFVSETLPSDVAVALEALGWKVVDTRMLPYSSDQERQTAIQAILAGIRMGSIQNRPGLKDFLELEGKSCGLIGNKEPAKPSSDVLDRSTLEEVLSFGSSRSEMSASVVGNTSNPTKRRRKSKAADNS